MINTDLLSEFFRRVTLDDVDIIAEGEEPKHDHYILTSDIPEIVEIIKTQEEKKAIELIAGKIRKKGKK